MAASRMTRRLKAGRKVRSSNSMPAAKPISTAKAARPGERSGSPGSRHHDEGDEQRQRGSQADQARVAQDAQRDVVRVRLAHREAQRRSGRLAGQRHAARPDAEGRILRPGRERVAPQVAAIDERADVGEPRRDEGHRQGQHGQAGHRQAHVARRQPPGARHQRRPARPQAPQRGRRHQHQSGDRRRQPGRARTGEERQRHRHGGQPDQHRAPQPALRDQERHRQRTHHREGRHRQRAEDGALVIEAYRRQAGAAGHQPCHPTPGQDRDRVQRECQDRDRHHQRRPVRAMAQRQQRGRQHQGEADDRGQRAGREARVPGGQAGDPEGQQQRQDRDLQRRARQVAAAQRDPQQAAEDGHRGQVQRPAGSAGPRGLRPSRRRTAPPGRSPPRPARPDDEE